MRPLPIIAAQVLSPFLVALAAGLACQNAAAALPEKLLAEDGSQMVLVPAGPFLMGTGEGREDESPPHRRDVPAFYIDRTEVTNAQYARFVAATGTPAPVNWGGGIPPAGKENLPVGDVTWLNAMRYAAWAGKRLPTEAEWEKAARGGDGRRYPWGNADDANRRNLDTGRLEPPGTRLTGASPYGCLDLCGNVWEWTADWYEGYPGTSARSSHFGRQYKVIRGGAAEAFYGVPNTGLTSQRARLVPYGSHDFLGFRCVRDAEGVKPPYDARGLLVEVESQLRTALRPAAALAYETECTQYAKARKIPLRVVGPARASGHVRAGIPLPRGVLHNVDALRLTGLDGQPCAVQTRVLAPWKDGSVRWALVDFVGKAGETYEVAFDGGNRLSAEGGALVVNQSPQQITIETGAVSVQLTPRQLIKAIRSSQGAAVAGPLVMRLQLESNRGPVELTAAPAEKTEIEDAGPVACTVRLQGGFVPAGTSATAMQESFGFRYDLRITATAHSSRLGLLATVTRRAKRNVPPVKLREASLAFALAEPGKQAVFGGDRNVVKLPIADRVELVQPDDLRYSVLQGAAKVAEGTRAPGWLAVEAPSAWFVLGTRHFWQNCPQALFVTPATSGLRFWAGAEPFEWEGGLAKTHELVVDLAAAAPERFDMEPLRATVPPAWACGSEAIGPLLPRDRQSLALFPYWEVLRESSMREWVRGMPYGLRDFGDAYMGGPYKGKNAYSNLEYDVPFNFLLEYYRTGQNWYLEAAEVQARHQADIDTDHFSGRPWKHSPLHTTTEAEWGHVFVRGLLLHYLATGERRSLEAAREIGDALAPEVAALRGIGNERQIGWSLNALAGLYEVTRDERYIKAAQEACLKLAAGQAPTGQFRIRWDNRIAFFNGIAMQGMLSVYQECQDERIAEAVLRVARRTMGFYPEYAGRTLNAYCWAAETRPDGRYIDMLDRTWRTTLEYLMPREAATAGTYMWQFPRFAAKHGLFPMFDEAPASAGPGRTAPAGSSAGRGMSLDALPDPGTWHGLRLEGERAEVYVQGRSGHGAALLIVLEGLAEGQAEVLDAEGRTVRTLRFSDASRLFQGDVWSAGDGRLYRLRLAAPRANAWQLHYDAGTRVTVYDPTSGYLPKLLPRAFGFLKEGTTQVKARLEVMGEGFHMATLYDPDGRPVSTVRRFVDFEDPGRYEIELAGPVDGSRPRGWSLEVHNAKVLSLEGFTPYWAAEAESLVNPERPRE